VLFRVMLCRFIRMLSGMEMVTMRNVGMVSGLFVGASLVLLGRFAMMLGGMLVVLCCPLVMFHTLILCHFLWFSFFATLSALGIGTQPTATRTLLRCQKDILALLYFRDEKVKT
jgi:hypothetical protein